MKKKIAIFTAFSALFTGISLSAGINTAGNFGVGSNKLNTSLNAASGGGGSSAQTPGTSNNLTFDLNATSKNSLYHASNFYVQNDMPAITNTNGPVLLNDNGRTIAGYDWYGNVSWFLTLNSDQSPTNGKSDAQASYYKYSNATSNNINWNEVGKKIVDTAYLAEKDFLYVLTDTSYLFLINSTTGTINSVKKLDNGINKISLIDFNKSLYGWDSKQNNQNVYNIDTQKLTTQVVIDRSSKGQTNNNGLKDKYIFDILPLDVGYNIAIVSNNAINGISTNGSSSLEAIFIQDDGNLFPNSNGAQSSNEVNKDTNGIPKKTITLDTSTNWKDIYSITLKRKSSSSNILIVGKQVFNIVLNKSAMENTTFEEITFPNTTKNATTNVQNSLKLINSAFVDENDLVYFKDASAIIYQISLNNKINSNISIPTSGGTAVFKNEDVNEARIYPVLKSEGSIIARQGTGYIATPKNFSATGFLNGSILGKNFNNSASRPSLSLRNYNNISPSSVTENNINISVASEFDSYNTEFYADDISGELFLKTRLIMSSWYDNSLNAKTTSYVIGKWNCAKIEDVTKWVGQGQFNQIGGGIFAKRSPDQISDQDVTRYAEQILSLPTSVTSSKWKSVNIIVKERSSSEQSSNGEKLNDQIVLKATIQYENSQGTRVSYAMKEETYKVRKEAREYNFKFFGGSEVNPNKMDEIDIGNLGDSFSSFKNTLPSLIKPTSDNLEAFIETQDKYPTDTRRVITISEADDEKGSIVVNVYYNNLAPTVDASFSIKYTGLATETSNKINFNGEESKYNPSVAGTPVFKEDIKDITTIANYVDYNKMLATEIVPEKLNFVYQSDLSLMGFNPKLNIKKDANGQLASHDAEYGSIVVELDYTDSYSERLGIKLPASYWDKFGLKEGKITQRYIGFLPIGETYNIGLKSYESKEIQDIVQNNNVNALITPAQLETTLDVKGYDTEVDSSGKKLPAKIDVTSFYWDGEDLVFTVTAQSNLYQSVSSTKQLSISWTPKFAAVRQRNLVVASSTSVVGVALVSSLVSLYILKRNKIRRLLK